MEIFQIEVIHIRRGIEMAQCPIKIQRRGREGNTQTLRQHHLHRVAGQDVFTHFLDGIFKIVFAKARHKICLGNAVGIQI